MQLSEGSLSKKELRVTKDQEYEINSHVAILNSLRDSVLHKSFPDPIWMDSLELNVNKELFSEIQQIEYNLVTGLIAEGNDLYEEAYAKLDNVYSQLDSLHPFDRIYLLDVLGNLCYHHLAKPFSHYFEEELRLLEQEQFQHPMVKRFFYTRAIIQRKKGELDQAIASIKQGQKYLEDIPGEAYRSYYANLLGNLYYDKKEFDLARPQYSKAVELEKVAGTRAFFKENLARCLVYCDSAAIGEPLILENIEAGLNLKNSFNVLGLIKLNLDQYEEAEIAYLEFLRLVPDSAYIEKCEAQRGVGISKYYRKQYAASINDFERCLQWIELEMNSDNTPDQTKNKTYLVEVIRTHAWLAMNDFGIELRSGSETFKNFLDHYVIIDSFMQDSRMLMSENLQRSLSREYKQIFTAGINRVQDALKMGVPRSLEKEFFSRILQWFDYNKSGILDRYRHMLSQDPEGSERLKLTAMESRLIKYNRLNRDGQLFSEIQSLKDSIGSLNLFNPEPLHIDYHQVIRQLPEGTAVLAFIHTNDLIYAYVLTRDTMKFDTIDIDATLGADIESYLELVSHEPKSTKSDSFDPLARKLYQLLLGKFELILKPMQKWIVLGDGILDNFPLESLIHPMDPASRFDEYKYLIREHDISYGFSLNLWLNHLEIDTIYNPHISMSCRDEDILMEECDILSALFPSSSSLIEGAGDYVDAVSSSDIIHFATHGYVDPSYISGSYLLLNNDTLHVADIYRQPVASALITLAACDTRQGIYEQGEGTYSLARLFYMFGAQHIISASWRIPINIVPELMHSTYQYILNGVEVGTAVSSAKLSYLEQADLMQSHPYYWAGINSYGQSLVFMFDHKNL